MLFPAPGCDSTIIRVAKRRMRRGPRAAEVCSWAMLHPCGNVPNMLAVLDDKLTGYRCFLPAYGLAKSMNAACKPETLSAIPQHQDLWQTFVSSHPTSRPLPFLLASSMTCTPGTEPACASFAAFPSRLKQSKEQEQPTHAGTTSQSKEPPWLTVCSDVRTEGKKDCPMGTVLCQGKQINKPSAELEEEGHVISKRV
jgi:hypothetical protein